MPCAWAGTTLIVKGRISAKVRTLQGFASNVSAVPTCANPASLDEGSNVVKLLQFLLRHCT
jgi:hypothetical protein